MRSIFSATLIVALALGVPVLLITTIFLFAMAPSAAALGTGLAVVYAAVVIALLRLLPQWPRRASAWWVAAALAWGSAVGFLAAMLTGEFWFDFALALDWEESSASWGGAYPEELSKAIGVAVILMIFRHLNRPWHGFIVGTVVGLSFEVFENLSYGATFGMMDPSSDAEGALRMWGLRVVAGALIHATWTGVAGWGIGLALFSQHKSTGWRIGQAVGWTLLAFALHWAWNYDVADENVFVIKMIVTLVITYGAWVWILVRTWNPARQTSGYVLTSGVVRSAEELAGLVAQGGTRQVRHRAKHRARR